MSPLACATLNIVALFVAGSTLSARDEFRLQRLDGAIKLDGHSDEAAWQAIAPVPLTMRQPTFDGTPTERTEIRLAQGSTIAALFGLNVFNFAGIVLKPLIV